MRASLRQLQVLRGTLLAIGLGLACLAATPGNGAALGLSGGVEWSYGAYEGTRGDVETRADWFYQDYSLLYRTRGDLFDRRMGKWRFGLGYEWTGLSGESGGEATDMTRDKLLFEGLVDIRPGGVPFAFSASTRDLRGNSAEYEDIGVSEAIAEQRLNGIEFARIAAVTGIYNGQHIENRITFLGGIRNGSYMGSYREMLSHLPMLVFQYTENLVSDSDNEDFELRDLAFISLNKIDNWFHYRLLEYQDNLDPNNDYRDKRITLGTIDHLNVRRWINLTNWVQLSADVTLQEFRKETMVEDFEEYRGNLFLNGRYDGFKLETFTDFARRRDLGDDSITRQMAVPVFFQWENHRDKKLYLQLIGEARDEDRMDGDQTYRDLYSEARLEITALSGSRFTPILEAETLQDRITRNGRAARLGLEYVAPVRQRGGQLFIAGALGRFAGENATGAQPDTDLTELTLGGAYERNLTPDLRLRVSDEFAYASGAYYGLQGYLQPKVTAGSALQSFEQLGDITDDTWTNDLMVSLGHRRGRNRNTFDLMVESGSQRPNRFELRHLFEQDRRVIALSSQTSLVHGSGLRSLGDVSFRTSALPPRHYLLNGIDQVLQNLTTFRWLPTRSLALELSGFGSWRNAEEGDALQAEFSETLDYTIYRNAGLRHRLMSFRQTLAAGVISLPEGDFTLLETAFQGGLYPTSRTYLEAKALYGLDDSLDIDRYRYVATVGLKTQLTELMLRYSYGNAREGGEKSDEQLVEVKAKRLF